MTFRRDANAYAVIVGQQLKKAILVQTLGYDPERLEVVEFCIGLQAARRKASRILVWAI